MKNKDGEKIPDMIVWSETAGYDAKTKSYPTNLGAPSFEAPNLALVKSDAGKKC